MTHGNVSLEQSATGYLKRLAQLDANPKMQLNTDLHAIHYLHETWTVYILDSTLLLSSDLDFIVLPRYQMGDG
jgi:hypothetical protein